MMESSWYFYGYIFVVYFNAWLKTAVCIVCAPGPGLDGGRTFFNAVKEGDTVIFASDDEQDRILWVQAMYRATGQSHKPVPPTQVQKLNSRGGAAPQLDAPISQFCKFPTFSVYTQHRRWWCCMVFIIRVIKPSLVTLFNHTPSD